MNRARKRLADSTQDSASALYAIIHHVLNKPRTFGIAHPEYELNQEEKERLDRAFERLMDGIPLPYITGVQEFFGIDFFVSPSVLIPRPETEILVSTALEWLKRDKSEKIGADVGAGSGCIALSILLNHSYISLFGLDISYHALKIAQENAAIHHLENRFVPVQTDLLSVFEGPLDCIFANLPYIPTERLENLNVSKFEPRQALDGGLDGLEYIHSLLKQAKGIINPEGLILLEIDAFQSKAVHTLAETYFPQASIKIIDDLSGNPRIVQILNKK